MVLPIRGVNLKSPDFVLYRGLQTVRKAFYRGFRHLPGHCCKGL